MAQQIKKTRVVNKMGTWFKNIANSQMGVYKDIITDMMPTSIDMGEGFINSISDIKSLISDSSPGMKQTMKETTDLLKRSLETAKKQIISGDYSDESGFGMMDDDDWADEFGFSMDDDDFDISFDDDDIDMGSKVIKETIVASTNAQAVQTAAQTSIMSNLIQASTQSNAKMMMANTVTLQRIGSQMANGMQAINDNLSMLVSFHSQTMGSYVAASMKFYEDSLTIMKNMSTTYGLTGKDDNSNYKGLKFDSSIIGTYGGINVPQYVERIKKNIKNTSDSSLIFTMISQLFNKDMLELIVQNPIQTVMKSLTESIIPGAFKNAAMHLDKSISTFLPALLMKVSDWADDYSNGVKRSIGEILEIDRSYKKKIEYKKIDNKPIPFDADTKNYIAANLVYQRKILSALTGSPELMYDVRTNTFKTEAKMRNKMESDRRYAELPFELKSDISNMSQLLYSLNSNYTYDKRKEITKGYEDMFMNLAKSRSLQDISTRENIEKIVKENAGDINEEYIPIMTSMLYSLPDNVKARMFGRYLIEIREKHNRYMEKIENHKTPYDFAYDDSNTFSQFKSVDAVKNTKGYIQSSDSSMLFKEKTDRFGMSMFDYLYDLKYILLKGIRVFPLYRHLETENPSGEDPTAYMDSMLKKMHEDYMSSKATDKDKEVLKSQTTVVTEADEDPLDRIEREKFQNAFFESQFKDKMTEEENYYKEDNKKSILTRFGNFLQKNTGLNQFGPFRKVAQFSRIAGDVVQGAVDDLDSLFFKVIFGLEDEQGGPSFFQKFSAEMRGLFGKYKDSLKTAFFGEGDEVAASSVNDKSTGGTKEKVMGVVQQSVHSIAKGFGDLSILMFGKSPSEIYKSADKQKIVEELRKKTPKAAAGAVVGSGISIMGGSLGILPAMILPGGPIGAAILGSAVGIASSSENFKKLLFGEKDENNERIGGLISKDMIQNVKKNKNALVIGGSAGALKALILGNGVLGSALFGAGPIGGAIMGMGVALATQSEKFKSLMFGKMLEDGSRDKTTGIITKFVSALKGTLHKKEDKDGFKFDIGKIVAGATVGTLGSTIIGQLGILGGLMTFGGSPIFGALAGAAAGITASSKRWTDAIFGERDENGKRKGGSLKKIKNWLQINMGEPLKNKIEEYKIESSHWFTTKFADPLKAAIDPLTNALNNAVSATKSFIRKGLTKLVSKIFNTDSGLIGKFFKGTGKFIGKTADFTVRKGASLLGTALTAPISLAKGAFNMYNNRSARKKYNNALDELYYGVNETDDDTQKMGPLKSLLLGGIGAPIYEKIKRGQARKRRLAEGDESIKLNTMQYLKSKFSNQIGLEYMKDMYGEVPEDVIGKKNIIDKFLLHRKGIKQYKSDLKAEYQEDPNMNWWQYQAKKFDRDARKKYLEDNVGYVPDYLQDKPHDPDELKKYEARKARLTERKEQLKLKKEMAEQLGYKSVNEAGEDIDWIYDKGVKFSKDENNNIKAVKETVKTEHEMKTEAVQSTISDNVFDIKKKMDDIVEAIHTTNRSTSATEEAMRNMHMSTTESLSTLTNTTSDSMTKLHETTASVADKITDAAKKEDYEDDRLSYELAGYDPDTKKKLGEQKDVEWLLKNQKTTTTTEATDKETEQVGKVVENSLLNTLNSATSILGSIFSGITSGASSLISSIFGTSGSGFLSTLMTGISSVGFALAFPAIYEAAGQFGAGVNAEGETIENESLQQVAVNHLENKTVKPVAKKVYNKFGKEKVQTAINNTIDNVASGKIFTETAQETGEKMAKTVAGETAESVAESVMKTTAKEGTETAVKQGTESFAKKTVREAFEKAIKCIGEFFANKVCISQLGESTAKKAASYVVDLLKKLVTKVLSSETLIAKFFKKVGVVTAKGVGTALSAGLIDVAFAGWDFFNGATDAETADIFKVSQDDVNMGMKICSGCIKALFGCGPMVLIDFGIEILNVLMGFDIKKDLATMVYEQFAGEESEQLLAASQQQFEESLKAYNQKNGTNLTLAQYSDEVNKSWLSKAWDWLMGGSSSDPSDEVEESTVDYADSSELSSASGATVVSYSTSEGGKGIDTTKTLDFSEVMGGKGSSTSAVQGGKGVEPEVLNGFAYFSQNDDRYANLEYKPSAGGSFSDPTIAERACGPTSAAMVIKQLTGDETVTPKTLCDYSTSIGTSVEVGTDWGFFPAVANKYGLTVTQVDPTKDNLSAISPENPMIISGEGGRFYGGHFVVGVDSDGSNVTINDPISSSSSGKMSISSLLNHTRAGWIYGGGDSNWGSTYSGDNVVSATASLQDDGSVSTTTYNSDGEANEKEQAYDIFGNISELTELTSHLDFLDFLNEANTSLINATLTGTDYDASSIYANYMSSKDSDSTSAIIADTASSSSSSTGTTSYDSSSGAKVIDGVKLNGDRDGLFHISAKYESGDYDPAAIGNDSTGGYSYGLFQFAQNGGAPGFVSYLQSTYPDLYEQLGSNIGSTTFNSNWKSLATGSDKADFQVAQEEYAYNNYYLPTVNSVPELEIPDRMLAAKQISFSTGVHLGISQAKQAFDDSCDNSMTDEEFITAIQDEKKLWFGTSTAAVRAAVINRLENEKNYALELLAEQRQAKSTAASSVKSTNLVSTTSNGTTAEAKGGKGTRELVDVNKYDLNVVRAALRSNPKMANVFAQKGPKPNKVKPIETQKMIKPTKVTGGKGTTSTASTVSNTDAFSTYIRQTSSNNESLAISELIQSVITLLSSIDTNTATTANNISNIGTNVTNVTVPETSDSITANLFANTNGSTSSTAASQSVARDRSNMLEKMRLIASGGA